MHVTSEFHTRPGVPRVLDALKITRAEWNATNALPSHVFAESGGSKIVYLPDLRTRGDNGDEPSDPPPGAAAARPYKLKFLQAVGAPEACAA